ncbi:alkane 1-monooxygenase [Zavarzinia compransoris]|uniref:Alkane 1-monooxygenase n=1 Tax=Zavarzinia compransoris TaxID=1264899 RepID=A0A317E8U9_9PROT|nr:alkane 1-monooxygenase [Zavarzinia compransoris]PWR21733.1 alkane 1-monooxygenase [Zavarzinia compransoris]TDP45479.1 alkane 1-monooxygenase [Zavarzinia compransoris]
MLRYGQFFLCYPIVLATTAGLLLGGPFVWTGLALTLILGGAIDQFFAPDTSEPDYGQTWVLDALLYGVLPLIGLMLLGFAWFLAAPASDLFGLGALVQQATGYDALAARAEAGGFTFAGAMISVGTMLGVAGINVGHELTHRTWDRWSMLFGRWMLATAYDASFGIEHVYGHHKNIATYDDPATSRKGETLYTFVFRSAWGQYRNEFRLERDRLARRNRHWLHGDNRFLRGLAMQAGITGLFALAAGPVGALAYAATALFGKSWLEYVNYIEHYGIVRVPGTQVRTDHSWNSNHAVSSKILFNLTRHSDHHAHGDKPFWDLKPYLDAPTMPYGYIVMIMIAFVPPLWFRVMAPKVREWETNHATPAERAILRGETPRDTLVAAE